MLSASGRRVFIENKSSVTCYDFNDTTEQWDKFGANYTSGFKKDGKVVKNSQNTHIGFAASKGGNVVVAHNMGTSSIDVYKFNLKTSIWKKIQTITNIEPDNSESGSYDIDLKGEHFVIYVNNTSNNGDLYYYAFNSSTKVFDLKFTITNISGITNTKSLRKVKINGNGSRFIISDTNGNVFATVNDNNNGTLKVYDVNLTNYSYSLNSTLSSGNDSALFGNAITIDNCGNRLAVSEPLEHKYYIYDYNSGTSSWSIPTGFTLDSKDNTSDRYNNVIEFNKLGDALFIGEYDDNDVEKGLVFGYYYDTSNSSWEEYQTLSGEFYDSTASSAINQFSSDTSFTDSNSFGSLLSVSAQGTTLLVGSHELASTSNNDNALIIKDPVAATKTFTDLGLTGAQIVQLGLSPKELVNQGGLDVSAMLQLNVKANTLLIGGKTEIELYNGGYSLCQIASASSSDLSGIVNDNSLNVTPLDFLNCANVTVSTLISKSITQQQILDDISSTSDISNLKISEFKSAGFSASQLKGSGVELIPLLLGGYNSSQLINAGYSVNDLKNISLSANDLKNAGLTIADLSGDFDIADLLGANFDDSDFTNAGFTVNDTETLQVNLGAVTFSQEVKSVIKNPNVSSLTTTLPSASSLAEFFNLNPDVTNMVSVNATDASGEEITDISSGPVALTLDFPDLDINESYVLCKYDSSNNLMNPQPIGYPVKLTYNSVLGKFNAQLTSLSNVAPSFSAFAPNTNGNVPQIYFIGGSVQNNSISNITGNLNLRLLLPQFYFLNFTLNKNNFGTYFDLSGCHIKSVNLRSGNKLRGEIHRGLPSLAAENPNFTGEVPLKPTSKSAINPTKIIGDTYNLYFISFKKNGTVSLGSTYSITNKLDTIPVRDNGKINVKTTFSVIYDELPDLEVTGFAIRDPSIYVHAYNSGINEDGDEIIEYYTNKTRRLTILVNTNIKLAGSNTYNNEFIKYNNCSFFSFQRGGLQHKFLINSALDLLSDTGITTVSISFLEGSLTAEAGSQPLKKDQYDVVKFLIDTVPPKVTITSPDISSNSYWVSPSLGITITVDEGIRESSISEDSFVIENGSIDSVQRVKGGFNLYNAIVRPNDIDSDSQISIQLKAETIMDFGGNVNTIPSNKFIWNYDGTSPKVLSITSSDISNGDYYNKSYITLNIVFSEIITGLTNSDFEVTNSTISRLEGSGTDYSLRLTPSDSASSSEITLKIPANTVVDARNKSNVTDSETFTWNYDLTKPSISLSSTLANNSTTNDSVVTYSIFSNKELKSITLDSFTVTNATIFNLQGSGKEYSVDLSPSSNLETSISVKAYGVRDTTNNLNDIASQTYYWSYDGDSPIVSINSEDIDLELNNSDISINVVIKISDPYIDISYSDLTIGGGGSISNLSKNNTNDTFECVFTASTPYTENTLSIPQNTITDGAGNGNNASNIFTWKWNKARPTMTISSLDISSGDYSNLTSIQILFTPSEVISNFIVSDISHNGQITNLEASGNNYIATFRPYSNNKKTPKIVYIEVPENKFNDSYGYSNTSSSNLFVWNYDGIKPEITITSDTITSGDANNLTQIDIQFTFTKPLYQFTVSNITAINSSISDLTKINDLTYSAKLNSTYLNTRSNIELYIDENDITDLYGNTNDKTSIFYWTSDTLKPQILDMYARADKNYYYNNTGYIYTRQEYQSKLYVYLKFNRALSFASVGSFNVANTVDQSGNYYQYIINNVKLLKVQKDGTHLCQVQFRPYSWRAADNDSFPRYTKGSFYLKPFGVQDTMGNLNDISGELFTQIYDKTNPTVAISAINSSNQTVVSGSTTNDDFIYVNLIASKPVVENALDSAIVLTNCVMSNATWIVDETYTYRIKITPINPALSTSVKVNANLFKQLDNSDKTSLENETPFTWTSDTNKPYLTISSPNVSENETIIIQDISVNLSFSEALASDLTITDLSYSNGSIISNSFSGSGTSYTLSFSTNVAGGEASIYLPSDNTVLDGAGNNSVSNTFSWTYSNTRPRFTSITSPDISSGYYTNNHQIKLIFVADTQIEFTKENLNQYLSNSSVATFNTTNDISFEALIEVTDYDNINEAYVLLNIPKDAFYKTLTNGSKQYNNETYDFSFNYYDLIPNLEINSSSITNGGTTKTNYIDLTLQDPNNVNIYDLSSSDFIIYPDNSASYYISNFVGGDGSSNYSLRLNATEDETVQISLPINTYRNIVYQNNNEPKSFTWTRDTAPVTFNIESPYLNSGSSSTDASLSLIITSNKNINKNDIAEYLTINNATFTPLEGTSPGKEFTTSVIPKLKNLQSSIFIEEDVIYDVAGNVNTSASNTFTWTFTGVNPTVSLSSSSIPNGSTSSLGEISMNVVITGSSITLEESDLNVANGSVSNFSQVASDSSSVTYNFDLAASSQNVECSVFVPAGSFSDNFGVSNLRSAKFFYVFNNTTPILTITSPDVTTGSTSNKDIFNFNFTASTGVSGFTSSDITISGGSFDSLIPKPNNVFSSILRPNISLGTIEISIDSGVCTDSVTGTSNVATDTFTINYDKSRPELDLAANITRGSSNNTYEVVIDISSTKNIVDFDKSKISTNNCTIFKTRTLSLKNYKLFINPINNDIVSFNIPEGVFHDSFGNSNTELSGGTFEWTFDTQGVFIQLKTDDLQDNSGVTTNLQNINFVAEIDDDNEELVESDLSFNNLTIDSFTKRAGLSIYDIVTKTNTPGLIASLEIPANVIQDAANNYNLASTLFSWTYDTSVPSVTITSSDISSEDTTNTSSISLTFTLSKAVNSFVVSDITVVNGSITGFTKVSDTLYQGTLQPNTGYNGSIQVYVPQDTLQDAGFSYNTESNIFVWNCDNISPQYSLDFNNSQYNNGSILSVSNVDVNLAVTNGDDVSDVTLSDLSFVNGTISNFTKDSSFNYSFNFASDASNSVSSVFIPANTFQDAAGNSNNASNTLNWTYYTAPLTVSSISSNLVEDGGITNVDKIRMFFSLSEKIDNIENTTFLIGTQNLEIDGDSTIISRSIDGKDYSIDMIVPNPNSEDNPSVFSIKTDQTLSVNKSGSIIRTTIDPSSANLSFNWVYDNVNPTMNIFSSTQRNNSTTNISGIDLTFESTKDISSATFTSSDIVVLNNLGTISNFSGSGKTYNARLTPSTDISSGTIVVKVNPGAFTDTIGNLYESDASFTWNYDILPPTVEISSNTASNSTSDDAYIDISFIFSEAIKEDFVNNFGSIVTLENAKLSDVSGSGLTYSARLNPTTPDALSKVVILPNKITDIASNKNDVSSNEYLWTYNGEALTLTMESSDVENKGFHNSDSITVKLNASAAITSSFTTSDITVTNGSVSNLTNLDDTTDVSWQFTLTSSNAGQETIATIANNVLQNNLNNNLASSFSWTYDNVKPIISISAEKLDGTSLTSGVFNNSDLIKLIINGSEDISLTQSDISVNNGSLSNFKRVDTTTYSTHLHPSSVGEVSAFVLENSIFDVANNSNDASSNKFIWNYDNVAPTITITSNDISDNSNTDNSYVNLTITSNEPINGLQASSFTLKNCVVSTLTGSNGDSSYNLLINTSDWTSNQNATIQVAANQVTDRANNQNSSASNTFRVRFNKQVIRKKDYYELKQLFDDDTDISSDDIPNAKVIETIVLTSVDTMNDNDGVVIPDINENTDRKVFKVLMEQIFERNTKKKLRMKRSKIPIKSGTRTKLENKSRSKVVVANSNQSVSYSDLTTNNTDDAIFVPLSSVNDFIELTLANGEKFKFTQTASNVFRLDKPNGTQQTFNLNTDPDEDSFTYLGYTFILGGVTSFYEPPAQEDSSGDSSGAFVPCFMEGTQILTTNGYKNIENLIPHEDILLDDKNNELECLDIQQYIKPYNGIDFPHVVPKGACLSKKYTCTQDLYLTHNHAIYLPHLNKYYPSMRLKVPQDKTTIDKYVYYHVFTKNFFCDVIIANGIPCETHGKYVLETIQSLDNSGKLMKSILDKCEAENDGSRKRLTNKEFKSLTKKYMKKHKQKKKK